MPSLELNLSEEFTFGELYKMVKQFAEKNNVKLYDVKIKLDGGANNVTTILEAK